MIYYGLVGEFMFLLGVLTFVIINYFLAKKKNRSVTLWVILGFAFGFFSSGVLLLLPSQKLKGEEAPLHIKINYEVRNFIKDILNTFK